MKKLKEKLALILIYMPIILRSAGFLLIIEATLSMFIGETSLSIFFSIPIIIIFQYVLRIDWIINILLVIVTVIRQVFVFDSLNLEILIVGVVLYIIPMFPIIIMLISSSREKRREKRKTKKKQVEKRVTEWEHMMLKEKGLIELLYCPECGASYIKGKNSDKCAECGYVFEAKIDNKKNRKCYCINKSKSHDESLNENRYVKAFVDIYQKLRRLAINIPLFDTPDMELLSFLYAMTDYFAFQKHYSETKRSEISDILIKAMTDMFGCNKQQIDLVIKRNSLYSEFIRGRKPVGFCLLNALEFPNGIARCYTGLCDLMVDHAFYDDENSPLPLVDISNCYAVNNFVFKLADILEVYYNTL